MKPRAIGAALALCAAACAAAAVDETREFRLANGDVIRGTIVSQDSHEVVIQHPVLGKVTLPLAVLAPLPAPAQGPASDRQVPPLLRAPTPVRAAEEPDVRVLDSAAANDLQSAPRGMAPTVDPAMLAIPLPEPPPRAWKFIFDGNANYSQATDKQVDFRVAASIVYELKDVDRWSTNAEYFFKTVNSSTTDNNLLVTTVYDHYFGKDSKWLWFAKGQGQYSGTEAWEERLSGWAGFGYRFYDQKELKLLGKLGAGVSHEFGNSDTTTPELYGELEWNWRISPQQTLIGSAWIAPDVADLGEFRTLSRLEWQLKIDPPSNLSFLGGARWEYQSKVPADDNHNDIRLYLGLRYEL